MGGETRRALALQKSKAIRNMRQLNTSLTDRRRVSATTARNFFLQGVFLLHNFGLASPRSHERGPVEAGVSPSLCMVSFDLRALTSAAPLKLCLKRV